MLTELQDFDLEESDDENVLENDPLRDNERARESTVSFQFNSSTSYDDLTAIDWDREFAKERIRREKIKKSGSWLWLYDNSQDWFVLMGSGLMIGLLSALIDVVSQWLGGLRFGHCKNTFYLSRQFCCLGLDANDKCDDWVYWADSTASVGSYIGAYGIYILLSVLFAASASLLVVECAPYARRSGISEIKTMLGGFVIRGFLGLSTLTTKTIGLCLVVGAGLWVGKEGPLVHVACCCANLLTKLFTPIRTNEARKRQLLSAATAAGISVAFGSPVGGVLFMLEQLSFYANHTVMWQGFVCAMVASVALQTLNPFRTGKLVLFQVVFDKVWHKFELIPFAVVGAMGGFYGSLLVRLNMWFANWRVFGSTNTNLPAWCRSLSTVFRRYPIIEVAAIAGISAMINFPDVYSRLQSSVLLSYLFEQCDDSSSGALCDVNHWFGSLLLLSLAAIIGTVLTSYSFGAAIPAGMLMPSMLVGALGGRGIGLLMQSWQEKHPSFFLFSAVCPPDGSCITPGVYAIVGAASTLTGTTRLTVTSVVIMFELTGALTYVIPIMAGVMVSKWVADSLNENGIYESWINFLQYPLLSKLEDGTIPAIPVSDVMTTLNDMSVIHNHASVGELEHILDTTTVQGYPIVTSPSNLSLIGYITRKQLLVGLGAAKAASTNVCRFTHEDNAAQGFDFRPWCELTPLTLSSQSPLHMAAKMVQVLGLRYIIFTNRGRLDGLLTMKDICWLLRTFEDRENLNERSASSRRSRRSNHARAASADQETGLLDFDQDTD